MKIRGVIKPECSQRYCSEEAEVMTANLTDFGMANTMKTSGVGMSGGARRLHWVVEMGN